MDYGPLMLSCRGKQLSPLDYGGHDAWKLINGYLLFKNNFTSAPQLKTLINSIQNKRQHLSLPPALIAVDHEGGAVQRFEDEYFTKIPSASLIGQLYINDSSKAQKLMRDIALVSATELGSCGINLLLGPVLDLANFDLKQRTYSTNPLHIIQLTSSFLSELKAHGFHTVGKHFPGLGAALVDTHIHTAEMNLGFEELSTQHLQPFQALIKAQLLTGVMLAHGTYPLIDSSPIPASSFWIEEVLRTRYQFDGLIMTDCLNMLAAQPIGKNTSSRVLNCMHAGADIILLSHVFYSMKNVIAKLQSSPIFLEINRTQHNQRIARVFEQSKPLDYYLDLFESSAYQEAKKQIIAVNDNKISFYLSKEPSPSLMNQLVYAKWIKKIAKNILKYPSIREGLYQSYYYLLLWTKKLISIPKILSGNPILKMFLTKKRT